MAMQDDVLQQIISILMKELNPSKVYLFGSRARGDHRTNSDYDLVVIVKNLKDRKNTLIQNAQSSLFDIPYPIDIIIYTEEEFEVLTTQLGSIPETIIQEGQELLLG